MEHKGTFNRVEASKAQNAYIKENEDPQFPPMDGWCYSCRNNIYDKIEHKQGDRTYYSGITVERASKELITGCPHCHRSYCD